VPAVSAEKRKRAVNTLGFIDVSLESVVQIAR